MLLGASFINSILGLLRGQRVLLAGLLLIVSGPVAVLWVMYGLGLAC